jgi:hypothetical protein
MRRLQFIAAAAPLALREAPGTMVIDTCPKSTIAQAGRSDGANRTGMRASALEIGVAPDHRT